MTVDTILRGGLRYAARPLPIPTGPGSWQRRGSLRGRIADGMCGGDGGVPLASSRLCRSDSHEWYLVHAPRRRGCLSSFGSAQRRPAFVRERRFAVAALAALSTWSALRGGPERALAPLADRGACAALALCASWYFARNGGRTFAMAAGLSVSGAVTIALGLAQASGRALPAALTAAEGPAALFGPSTWPRSSSAGFASRRLDAGRKRRSAPRRVNSCGWRSPSAAPGTSTCSPRARCRSRWPSRSRASGWGPGGGCWPWQRGWPPWPC